jgi:hypothetical protein
MELICDREDSPASEKVGDEWRDKAEVAGSPRRVACRLRHDR